MSYQPRIAPRSRIRHVLLAVALMTMLLPSLAAEVARASSTYDMYFPVAGDNYYSDTFGAPRGGGRTHIGTDIMTYGVKGVPVIAVASGTVGWVSSNCCAMQLEHDDGWESWYIHLDNDTPGTDDGQGWGFAPGIGPGVHVAAGQLIGFVGDSGNAEAVAPHLHFELHDTSGTPVNPYPHLLEATPPPLCDGQPAHIIGTEGSDVLEGSPASEVIIGLGGDDILKGYGGDDTICGGDGNDQIYGGSGHDLIFGNVGSDVLIGGEGNDTIRAQKGHDVIKGGPGDDSIDGGKGEDTVSYSGSATGVLADLVSGTASGEGSDGFVNVENLRGSIYADVLIGDDGINILIGSKGSDSIFGGESGDVIKGGRGHDAIVASGGDDQIKGGRGDDTVDAGEGQDVVIGHAGDDMLDGSGGEDTLDGGDGMDTCLGGETLTGCEL